MPESLAQAPWYALEWLSWTQLNSFKWQHPYFLYALWVLLPLLFLGMEWQERQKQVRIAFGKATWLQRGHWSVYLRYMPRLLLLLVLVFMCVALARPQRVDELSETWSEGIDIMIAIDISPSMEIEDLRPNRLEAAKRTAIRFIKGRHHDRIGLVVFSGDAFSKAPLTQDYDLLHSEIASLSFGLIGQKGTAIGSAIATATNRMRDSEAKSKVLILLSDGANNAGQIDPITAAQLAEAFHIKIYTIAVGKEGEVPMGKNFFGLTHYVKSEIDIPTLKEIASIGKGKFYQAQNNRALGHIFQDIDQLERSEIKDRRFFRHKDYYSIYLRWALASLLAFLFLKGTFISNILQD